MAGDGVGSASAPPAAPASESMYPKIGEIAEGGDEVAPMAMESLCMNCGKNGQTRLMMTEIPFFRQVIIMSFRCEHCGMSNNEVKPGSAVQTLGGKYVLTCSDAEDLQRQVVKSDEASVRFEELDFEIPSGKGVFTNVEGLLTSALEELRDSQPARREHAPEVAAQVDAFIVRLTLALAGQSFPLTVVMDDPTGNSFLENPLAPKADPKMVYKTYPRSAETQARLGLQKVEYELEGEELAAEEARAAADKQSRQMKKGGEVSRDASNDSTIMEKEVFELPTPCPRCGVAGVTKSCLTDIPYFQDIIIMGFDCLSDDCGFKTNEIKGAGPVPAQGRRLRLGVARRGALPDEPRGFEMDMNRDVVKSNTAGVNIPELEIEVTPGSLGGMYTTVEGLLTLIKETLFESQAADMQRGDSAPDPIKQKFVALEEKFDLIIAGEMDFTLEIVDPLASSYIYSPCAPDPEPRLEVIDYVRSFDEDEELGLNDINVDNYDEISRAEKTKAAAETPEEAAATATATATATAAQQDPDADLEFHGPFKTFDGHKPNFVFRIGSKGLGYYRDLHRPSARNVVENMGKVQKGQDSTHPNRNAVQESDRDTL